jgi:alcohol dehydrogenase
LTGIDAISHAVETYVTKCRNTVSLMFSREAWRLLSSSYLRVLDRPDDLEARGAMQLGAAFAGLAIENSMLGAAHALANPLTQTFGIPHGEAVGLMLPHVIRFNGEVFPQWYCELANAADGLAACLDARSGATCLAETITAWTKRAGLATWLANLGVGEDRLPQLADAAAKQWTGTFNPRELTLANFLDLYHRAL